MAISPTTTLSERLNDFLAFQQKVYWIPLPSTSKLKQYTPSSNDDPNGGGSNGNDSFVLFLHTDCKYRLPNTSLPIGYTNPNAKFAIQYNVSLYDNTSLSIFGRTYTSSCLLPVERSVTDTNVLVTKEGDILYWLNSINNDPNLFLLIEPVLCLLDNQYTIIQSISLGWSLLNPFGHPSSAASIPFWTTNTVQQIMDNKSTNSNRLTLPVYTGTPRSLLISPILTGPLSPSSSSATASFLPPTVHTSTLVYSLYRYPMLRSLQSLLRYNSLFGPLDIIPGLKPNRIRKQMYQPLNHTDTATSDNNSTSTFLLSCLAPSSTELYMVPQLPQLPLTLGITINNILMCIPPGLENNLLRTLITNREIELGIKPGSIPASMVFIRNRYLHVSINNGYTNIHTSTIELFRNGSSNNMYGTLAVPGSILYEGDNELYLSGYVPHEYMAIIFRLEYIINEPTGTALGLKVAKQLQLQANSPASTTAVTMDNGSTDALNTLTNSMATSIVSNGTALEQRKRLLVGYRIYIPYQSNNKLVFANRQKRVDLATLNSYASMTNNNSSSSTTTTTTMLSYPLSFTCRSFEVPLDAPNPLNRTSTVLPLDGRLSMYDIDYGKNLIPKDGLTPTPLDTMNQCIIGMDIDLNVEKRKPVVTITVPSTNINNNTTNPVASVSNASSESIQTNMNSNNNTSFRTTNSDTSYDNEYNNGNLRSNTVSRNNDTHNNMNTNVSVSSRYPNSSDKDYPIHGNGKDDRKISFALDTSFRSSSSNRTDNDKDHSRSSNSNNRNGPNPSSSSATNYTDQPQSSSSVNTSYRYYDDRNNDSGYDSPESIGEDIEEDYHAVPSVSRTPNTVPPHSHASRPNVLEELLALPVARPDVYPSSSTTNPTTTAGPVIIPGTQSLGYSTPNPMQHTTNLQSMLPSAYDYLVPFDNYPIAYSPYGSPLLRNEELYLRKQNVPSLLYASSNGTHSYTDRLNFLLHTPLYRTIQTELSDSLSVNLLTLTFLTYTPNLRSSLYTTQSSSSGVPKKLSFALQFYSSPYIRTDTVTLHDISSTVTIPTTKPLLSRSTGDTVSMNDELNHQSTRLYVLQSSASTVSSSLVSYGENVSFLSIRIRITPRNDEDRLSFIHYMTTKALTIEVWDAESLLPVGNVSLHLSQFLRQQAQYTSQTVSCDVVSPLGLDYPVSANPHTGDNVCPAVLGLPSSHSNTYTGLNAGTVVGRLLILGNCIGQKSVPWSTKPNENLLPSTTVTGKVSSSSVTATTRNPSTNITHTVGTQSVTNGIITGRQGRVRVIAKPLTHDGTKPDPSSGETVVSSVLDEIPGKTNGNNDSTKVAMILSSVPAPSSSSLLHDPENEILARQRELSTVQNYRNDVRNNVITEHLRALSTATYTFSSSYGLSKYMELTVRNPSSLYPDTVTVKVLDDINNEIRIVTNISEWNYLRTTLPLVCPDAGLSTHHPPSRTVKDYNWKMVSPTMLQVSLGPDESITIPIVFTPSAASADILWSSNDTEALSVTTNTVPATDAWKVTKGETLDTYFPSLSSRTAGYANVFDTVRHFQIHVSATSVAEPLALLHIQPTLRPFPIHRTIRYFHPEVSYLRGTLPVPTVPLPLAAASYMNPLPSMDPTNNTAYLASPSVVTHDPMVLLQLIDDPYGGKEILFRYKTGTFPATNTFYVHVYADPYNAVLVETWRIVIHAVLAVDIHSTIGQSTTLDLVVRGAPFPRQARIYGTANDILNTVIAKLPENNITLVPHALTRVPLSLQPLRSTLNPYTNTILSRSLYISLVENTNEAVSPSSIDYVSSPSSKNNLVCMWYVGITLNPSHVSRIYDITIPLGNQFILKKLSYVNAWGRSRTVRFSVSHPSLVTVPSSLSLEPYRTEPLSLKFSPVQQEAQEMVYIYVEDETGTLEDTFLLRIVYSPNAKLVAAKTTSTSVKHTGTVKVRYGSGTTHNLNHSLLNRTNENILNTSIVSPVKTDNFVMKQL